MEKHSMNVSRRVILVSISIVTFIAAALLAGGSSQSAPKLTINLAAPTSVPLAKVGSIGFTVQVTNNSGTAISFGTAFPYGVRIALFDVRMKPVCDFKHYGFNQKFRTPGEKDLKTLQPHSTAVFYRGIYALRRPLTPGRYFARAELVNTPISEWQRKFLHLMYKKHVKLWDEPEIESSEKAFIIFH